MKGLCRDETSPTVDLQGAGSGLDHTPRCFLGIERGVAGLPWHHVPFGGPLHPTVRGPGASRQTRRCSARRTKCPPAHCCDKGCPRCRCRRSRRHRRPCSRRWSRRSAWLSGVAKLWPNITFGWIWRYFDQLKVPAGKVLRGVEGHVRCKRNAPLPCRDPHFIGQSLACGSASFSNTLFTICVSYLPSARLATLTR